MAADPGERAFYVTTPIYYVNDVPHLGHAYTTVAADVIARWHRQRGEPVHFLTGTDEHGQKVMRSAQAAGVTPKEWCDRLVESEWEPVLDVLDISNDDFIRTTEQRHIDRVRVFWQALYDAGHVYQGRYEGPYCVSCEEFKLESELDQDEDGTLLCPIHGRPVEIIAETNYFFRLSAFGDRLLALYEEHPEFVQPESTRNELISFVRRGLQDLSITRSTFDWGIPVPWDDEHVLYVWIEALLNYATAAGYGADEREAKEGGPAGWDETAFSRIWPANLHLVGKDIARFHAVTWPAMLMAAGVDVPETVFAHGWLLVGGQKMSKTKLTGIHPRDIVDHFGSDAFRYYFVRAVHFGSDGSFSWENMSAIYTAELANGLGNLASRVAAMVGRYFDGVLPKPADHGPAEDALVTRLAGTVSTADEALGRFALHDALAATNDLVGAVNGYVTEQEPWRVAKSDAEESRARLATILYTAAEALRAVAVLHNPVMPKVCARLWQLLGAEQHLGPLAEQRLRDAGTWGHLAAGAQVTKGEPLFPRLADDT